MKDLDAPTLEAFKIRLGRALSNLIYWKISMPVAGEAGTRWSLKGPFQPKPFRFYKKKLTPLQKNKTIVMKIEDSDIKIKLFQDSLLPLCVSFQMMFAHKQILYHCTPQVHLEGKSIFIRVNFLQKKESQTKQKHKQTVSNTFIKLNHSTFGNDVPPYPFKCNKLPLTLFQKFTLLDSFSQKNQDFGVRNKKEINTTARLNRLPLTIQRKKSYMRTLRYLLPSQ